MVEDEASIMEEIPSFFKELYTHGEEILRNGQERKQVLDLITWKLPMGANANLDRTPDMGQLEGVVKCFTKEKAPVIDGLTTEVLVGC